MVKESQELSSFVGVIFLFEIRLDRVFSLWNIVRVFFFLIWINSRSPAAEYILFLSFQNLKNIHSLLLRYQLIFGSLLFSMYQLIYMSYTIMSNHILVSATFLWITLSLLVLESRDEKSQLLLGIRRAKKQSMNISSSVLSSDSMLIGILAAAAHAATNHSPFTVFYNPRSVFLLLFLLSFFFFFFKF